MNMITETQVMPIEKVPMGEFIRKIRKDGTPFQGVFTRQAFCRYEKKYQCDDENDISRCVYLKKGTIVLVGFDY
jgi:hypothetical protein